MRHLAAALRQAHPDRWCDTTGLLRLPPADTATAPIWSPGPGYVEIRTARVWARATGDGRTHAVVVFREDPDTEVRSDAEVTTDRVLGMGGLNDKPHRIRWMAAHGSLRTEPLAPGHPVLAYRGWCHRLTDQLDHHLATYRYHRGVYGDPLHLSRIPGGGFQATTNILVDPDQYHHDVAGHAAALAGLARTLGRGTRLRFCTDDDPACDPLYHHAYQHLRGSTCDTLPSATANYG